MSDAATQAPAGQAQAAQMLLELKGVHTHIGEYHILQGVDLCVPRADFPFY